jgi:ribosomal protein S18 acetylase RimI-like enzyme
MLKNKKSEKKTLKYKIRLIIPENQPITFKKYIENLKELLKICFNLDIDINVNNDLWGFAIYKKKIIGCLYIDTDNVIWNVCTDPLYRGKGIAKKLILKIIKKRCENPIYLSVSKIQDINNYNKRIDLYKNLGFKIYSDNEKYTTMNYI